MFIVSYRASLWFHSGTPIHFEWPRRTSWERGRRRGRWLCLERSRWHQASARTTSAGSDAQSSPKIMQDQVDITYKVTFSSIQWNPSCEVGAFAPEKWPFKRGGLSSVVEINTFMFRFTCLSRGGWPSKRFKCIYRRNLQNLRNYKMEYVKMKEIIF